MGIPTDLAVVVQKAYDWNLWIVPKVENFPKAHRFSIGQYILQSSVDLLMHLVDATYQKKNATSLGGAVRHVNRVRYLIRLSKDLKVMNLGSYEFAAQTLDEIGRMTGGWLKHSRERGE